MLNRYHHLKGQAQGTAPTPGNIMKHIFPLTILTSILLLAACKPYEMDIPQGKTLSPQQIAQIKPGMTKEAVLLDLGTPLQGASAYDVNRLDYIVTMQKNGGVINENRLSIYFKNGVVKEIIQKDYVSK